jgi:hypothetical protein
VAGFAVAGFRFCGGSDCGFWFCSGSDGWFGFCSGFGFGFRRQRSAVGFGFNVFLRPVKVDLGWVSALKIDLGIDAVC